MSLYNVGVQLIKTYCKLFLKIEVIGSENIERLPEDQGILLCSNHISLLDPPVVGSMCPREMSFMAKAELFKVPILGPIIKRVNAFPIKRGASDRASIKTAIHILNDGKVLIMFPEGTRSKDGTIGEGKPGAGFLALKTNALIVPVAVIGQYKLFKKTKIVYGEPIDFSYLRENRGKAAEASHLIMDAIKGLYAKHN